jgi:hypothetical protein
MDKRDRKDTPHASVRQKLVLMAFIAIAVLIIVIAAFSMKY